MKALKEWWEEQSKGRKRLQILILFLGFLNLGLPIEAKVSGRGINIWHMFNIMVGTWVLSNMVNEIWHLGYFYRKMRDLVERSTKQTDVLLEMIHKLQKENTELRELRDN